MYILQMEKPALISNEWKEFNQDLKSNVEDLNKKGLNWRVKFACKLIPRGRSEGE